MSFDVPADRRYAETHEWIAVEDGVGTVGITEFAQAELGDVIFIEFVVEVGDVVAPAEEIGTIESMKADSELYAPVGGEITAVNDALVDAPERVNDDPYGDGWLVRLRVDDPAAVESLLSADAYRSSTG